VTADAGVVAPVEGADFFRKMTHKIVDYLVALATTDTDDLCE
jgi:hypothetical protein